MLDDDIRNIGQADLSKVLRIFKKVSAIDKTKLMSTKILPGRPKNSDVSQKITGPKEYNYSDSDYFSKLKKLITIPNVRTAIYSILKESKILREYLKYSTLHMLYQLKSQDLDSTLKNDKKMKLGDEYFDEEKYRFRLSHLRDLLLSLDKNQIEIIAQAIVLDYMKTQDFRNEIYDLFYLTGGLYFKK